MLVCLINYCLIINPQGHTFHQWEENVIQTAKKYQIFHSSCFLIKGLHHEFKRAVQLHLGMVCLLFIPLMSSQAKPPLFLCLNRGFFGLAAVDRYSWKDTLGFPFCIPDVAVPTPGEGDRNAVILTLCTGQRNSEILSFFFFYLKTEQNCSENFGKGLDG